MNIKRETVTLDELKVNLGSNEIFLEKDDYNIILIKLFEFTMDVNELAYKKLFG
jgi:hypothetical protein